MNESKEMQQKIEEITQKLMSYTRQERLEIANFLLNMDCSPPDPDVDATWENVILKRLHQVESGEAVGVDFETAIKEIERHLDR